MLQKNLLLLFGLLTAMGLGAQITTDPVFPTQGPNDSVTIIYDASQGNAALAGVSPVYVHTGVITNLSQNPTDWRHVPTTWGVTNDPDAAMTSLGNNLWRKRYHVRNFYNVPVNETVQRLAFVFRNGTGTIVGRAADGSDMFVEVYGPGAGLVTLFLQPTANALIVNTNDVIPVSVAASVTATITLYDNGVQLAQTTGTALQHSLVAGASGDHLVRVEATDGGNTVSDTFYYVASPSPLVQDPPAGTLDGITYPNGTSARLKLYAPNKDYVFVLGDFNDWTPSSNYLMNRSVDGNTWWLDITGLDAGLSYAFQYWVDASIKIGDPYSEIVLDPSNDPFIPAITYPNLPAYPTGKTTGIVSVLEPGQTPYNWQNNNWSAPAKTDLVVYELLLRDFIARHDYATLLDTLDYLDRLGVNCIHLMPVNEFEGNISWGYNPSFHMALDKYYGTREALKQLVDECHARGISVVLDVVYNHAFSQSPLCQLYWDPVLFRPTPDNPWLNPEARHPFNVGYDFNHDSPATRNFIERVMRYWIQEFRVDGFRFDLSKGFTQTNSGGDVGLWGQYDASRIANIERIADVCWAANPDFYVILEHFADNWEEIELSNYGCMIWGNANCTYNQASMGYPSGPCDWNFNYGVNYQNRGWQNPHLIGYMESHDEERLMFKNLSFGNAAGTYDIQTLGTALARQELAACLFFTIPGPKMLWQFGELGYDKTINLCSDGVTVNNNCRTDPKPILWNYYTTPLRRKLFNVYKALIDLKISHPTFETTNFTVSAANVFKTVSLDGATMDALALGNFGVTAGTGNFTFSHTGWWYEYFTGDSLQVTGGTASIPLNPGAYRLYTDVRLPLPVINPVVALPEVATAPLNALEVYPNPMNGPLQIQYSLDNGGQVQFFLQDMLGRPVALVAEEMHGPGEFLLTWTPETQPAPGVYVLTMRVDGQLAGLAKVIVP